MKDETYSFISDVKEKGSVARSSKSRCTYSRGGKVRFPSDNLSKKELMKMNGECKSFRLNDPMSWDEFKALPDDLKVTYIKLIRNKFNVPFQYIGKMLGVTQRTISCEIIRLGLSEGKAAKGRSKKWDKDGFYAWANGVDKLPTPVMEEPEHCEPDPVNHEEPEAVVEEDLPWNIPEFVPEVKYPIPQTAVPANGSMTFKCPANLALNTLKVLLENEMVELSIMWRVVEEGSCEA